MANLFSQYASGAQLTAGTISGSASGVSGLNPIVDRLNSITSSDNLVTGSMISGTSSHYFGDVTISGTTSTFVGSNITSNISGVNIVIYASGGNVVETDINSDSFESTTLQLFTVSDFIDYSNGSTYLVVSGTESVFSVCDLTYYTSGAGVAGKNGFDYRLTRDNEDANSVTHNVVIGSMAQATPKGSASINWIDTPGAGGHTYELQIQPTLGSIVIKEVSMSSIRLKV